MLRGRLLCGVGLGVMCFGLSGFGCTDDGVATGPGGAIDASNLSDADTDAAPADASGEPCTPGEDAACDDGDSCTVDSCGEDGWCVHAAMTDFCLAGSDCVAVGEAAPDSACEICAVVDGSATWTDVDCGDDNPCTADVCDPVAGCASTPDDALPCDDGVACTTDDHCDAGVCTATPCACAEDADCAGRVAVEACQRAVCEGGQCATAPDASADGQACDDGDACTTGDTCASGVCGGAPMACWELATACVDAGCVDGECVVVQAAAGALCESACQSGAGCTEGGNCAGQWDTDGCGCAVDADCDDGLDCTIDTCDAATGACESVPAAGTCKLFGICFEAGDEHPLSPCLACDPTVDPLQWTWKTCDDGDPCTADSCDEASGCVNTAEPAFTPCDDGDACTSADACSDVGVCEGVPVDCSDQADACHAASCEAGACVVTLLDGASCDDGEACTTGDACGADGTCAGTWDWALPGCGCVEDADCEGDPGQCQTMQCVDNACVAVADVSADGQACDDGLACTTGDACDGGACVPAGDLDCTASGDGVCVVGVCDEAAGGCTSEPAADGTACDDGDACTTGDACDGSGGCAGVAVDCSDQASECVAASCDPATGGCVTAVTPGELCDDADPCTLVDTCTDQGSCIGTWDTDSCGCATDDDCAALTDACNIGRCDTGSNSCYAEATAGVPCDDGDACSWGDMCDTAGSCAGTTYTCTGASCQTATCDGAGGCDVVTVDGSCYADGACHADGAANPANPCQACDAAGNPGGWTDVGDGTGCDADGDGCTAGDSCQGGACVAGSVVTCDDGKSCTDDVCTSTGPDGYTCSNPDNGAGCHIGGACVADGATDPGNDCQVCDAGAAPGDWTVVPDGSSCGGGAGVCGAGVCVPYTYAWTTSAWGACSAEATWSTGGWGACSATCGDGTQSREVTCPTVSGTASRTVTCQRDDGVVVADGNCDAASKPAATQGCQDDTCDAPMPASSQSCSIYSYGWDAGGWGACSADAQWSVGGWSGCSTSCGTGSQSRSVTCPGASGTQSRAVQCLRCDGAVAGDASCDAGSKPAATQGCTDSSCDAPMPATSQSCTSWSYAWSTGGWSACSADAQWSVGGWGACSTTCGDGTQSRSVSCPTDYGTQTRTVDCLRCDGTSVSGGYCGGGAPASSQSCSDSSCPGSMPATTQGCTGNQCPCPYASTGSGGAICSGGPANHGETAGSCNEDGTCSFTCNNGNWQLNWFSCTPAAPTLGWSEISAVYFGQLSNPGVCSESSTPLCTGGTGSACSSEGAICKEWLECDSGFYYIIGRVCEAQ